MASDGSSISISITNQTGTTTLFTIDGQTDVVSTLNNVYKPRWARLEIPSKEGDIRHFLGSADNDVTITGAFRGTLSERVAKKNSLRSIALAGTIVRLDTGGYDSSIEDKDYVIISISVPEQGSEVWRFTLQFEEFNN